VGCADVGCGEDGEEGDARDGGLDRCATALFAVDEAEDSGDAHAGFASGFDGGDGGAAGCADVVYDNDLGAGFEEAFDFAAGAVGFFCFADEEALDEGGCGFVGRGFVIQFKDARELEDLVVVGEGPGAGAGGVGDEGVGTHGEATYGFGVRDVLADDVVEDEAREAAAFGVESSDSAVDVVVGLLAAGEGEVSEFEGESGDQVQESGLVVSVHGHCCSITGMLGGTPYCLRINRLESFIYGIVRPVKSSKQRYLRPKMCKQMTYGPQDECSLWSLPLFFSYLTV
jgi:hypothetical protein